MITDNSFITGWDIGGAHLKVARCNSEGKLIQVLQIPCPLWQGIEHLKQAIQSVQQQLGNQNDMAAITMTGELVDIFPDRQTGVAHILDCIATFIPEHNCHIYAGKEGWLKPDTAKQQWQYVASCNWKASANFVANKINNGLFVDIGSTTCDIIAVVQGSAVPRGYTDQQRLASRELLYTGAIRTPLFALTNMAPFNGELVSLAAEVFATSGDCWSLLGQLRVNDIQDASADGQSWSKTDCARRLARLLGTDALEPASVQWSQLAQWFAEQQVHEIIKACLQVLSAHPQLPPNAPIIGAGIGRFIVQKCAVHLGRDYIDFSSLTTPALDSAADHAPAVAVALLARHQIT
ncbi:MAG: H4MPT-linked C1 transfer pathway protein [Gammaproteobacteria bacterium]|nr:H4MPT-linked C1 transfer pathway protein [Gammaproteobacteria bacterium]MDH5592516.1 H4MPT-linked C1 transfer pathway protein [Gammaproteobacteria bacterium]